MQILTRKFSPAVSQDTFRAVGFEGTSVFLAYHHHLYHMADLRQCPFSANVSGSGAVG